MSVYLRVAARTDVGRVRSGNEDTFIAADLSRGKTSDAPSWSGLFEVGSRGLLLAVSDGMGGLTAGEVASARTIASLVQALESAPSGTPSRDDALDHPHRLHLVQLR
jgi:serine/threonine protein phosphatase PrpC